MASWYYVDATGQQVGPVEAEALRAALRGGQVTPASLAWREGLASWVPISQLDAELEANPYRAPESVTGEGYADNSDIVYAGFWRRWAALFLDQLILMIPLTILFGIMAFAMGITSMGAQPDVGKVLGMEAVFYLIWFVVGCFYYAAQESSEAQATLGKRALGIKVTGLAGERISFKNAVGRWFGAALSYMSMYIGFAMAGFTQRKQALHDLVAGTLVVDRWAFTGFPERQQRGLGGCAIIFIVVMVASLLLVPIMVAIAVSQYQSYLQRANGGSVYVAPPASSVCAAPAWSTYVARCRPLAFDA